MPRHVRSMTLALMSCFALVGCADALDESEGVPDTATTVRQQLNNVSAVWSNSIGSNGGFIVSFEGVRGNRATICFRPQSFSGSPCSDDDAKHIVELGASGTDFTPVAGKPNRVRQTVYAFPDVLSWPQCDTTYEIRVKRKATIGHLLTADSERACPSGGTYRSAQGGYPAACVVGSVTTSPPATGFLWAGSYYYTPVWGVAGSPCPAANSVYDGANCQMVSPFPTIPSGEQGLAIWPTTFAYEARCER